MRAISAAEKQAMGTYRPDRARKTPRFRAGQDIAAHPPAFIRKNKLALKEWRAVAAILEAEGVLKAPDVAQLASYCTLYSRWRDAAQHVEDEGQVVTITSTTRTGRTDKPVQNPWVRCEQTYAAAMMKAAVKFGLNPLDRPRVEVSPFEADQAAADADAAADAEFDAQLIDTPRKETR
jgi:P27 family predicted phage terminase small subunit